MGLSAKVFQYCMIQPVNYAQHKHLSMTDKDTIMRMGQDETEIILINTLHKHENNHILASN